MRILLSIVTFGLLFLLQGCNEASTRKNSTLSVRADTAHNVHISSGQLDRYHFSTDLVADRTVDVWLPQRYREAEKYPVIYMHDGQMLFDSTNTWNGREWQVDEVSRQLIENGNIGNVIIVGIWNNDSGRHAEYFPQKAIDYIPSPQKDSLLSSFANGPMADKYLKFLVKEVKPFIDENYATLKDRENTFVMGSSMGGLISLYAISEYPEIFGGSACLSTHWIGTMNPNKYIPLAINSYLKKYLPSPKSHKIYFDHGTQTLDAHYPSYQDLIDQTMQEKGYTADNWVSREFKGADHTEQAWAERLHIPLQFLLNE